MGRGRGGVQRHLPRGRVELGERVLESGGAVAEARARGVGLVLSAPGDSHLDEHGCERGEDGHQAFALLWRQLAPEIGWSAHTRSVFTL